MTKHQQVPFAAPFSYRQLLDDGGTPAQLRGWLQRGQVVRLARGIYVAAEVRLPQLPAEPRRRTAVQDGRVPVPTLEAAARHGLWLPVRIPPELVSADGRRCIPPEHLATDGGQLVPSLAWTALQVARWQPLHGALISLDCALRRGVSRGRLLDIAAGMHRWPGSRLLRSAIASADGRSESPLESWSRGLMIEAGLPAPDLQHEIVAQGVRMRADFAFLEQRVLGEADGHTKYAGNAHEAIRAEKQRQARLQAAGFVIVRWSWQDVHPKPHAWLHGLASALRRHR